MLIVQEVVIEASAPPGHAVAVEEAFKRAGFDIEVEDQLIEGRATGDVLPWLVQVGLDGTLTSFFAALGVDAYKRFKALVHDLWNAREGAGNGKGQIDFGDSEDTRLILPPSLPDEAFDALEDLDWDELRGGWIVWNADRKEWVDHTKRN